MSWFTLSFLLPLLSLSSGHSVGRTTAPHDGWGGLIGTFHNLLWTHLVSELGAGSAAYSHDGLPVLGASKGLPYKHGAGCPLCMWQEDKVRLSHSPQDAPADTKRVSQAPQLFPGGKTGPQDTLAGLSWLPSWDDSPAIATCTHSSSWAGRALFPRCGFLFFLFSLGKGRVWENGSDINSYHGDRVSLERFLLPSVHTEGGVPQPQGITGGCSPSADSS